MLFVRVVTAAWSVFFLSLLPAVAATVTTNEDALDAIFSQPGFSPPIDIRFLEPIGLNAPRYLSVDIVDTGSGPVNEMSALLLDPFPQMAELDRIYMIFVDTISVCGSETNFRIVGCAIVRPPPPADPSEPDPFANLVIRQAIESSFAAGRFGAELMAHEIVHNLGVGDHTADGRGLMGATLNGETTLNASEIAIIAESALLKYDGGDPLLPFLQVQPVLVTAVPLPWGVVMLASGIGALALRRRRKHPLRASAARRPAGSSLR